MCLAVPGEVIRWIDKEFPFCEAEVRFLGLHRKCNMCCVPEAEVGDFVVVHAGIAISKVNAESAAQMLKQISQVDWDEFEKEAKS